MQFAYVVTTMATLHQVCNCQLPVVTSANSISQCVCVTDWSIIVFMVITCLRRKVLELIKIDVEGGGEILCNKQIKGGS